MKRSPTSPRRVRSQKLWVGVGIVALALAAGACVGTPPPPKASPVLSAAPPVTIGPVAAPTTAERLLALARQSVFRVRNAQCASTGTSFAVARGIVTNRHVASGAKNLELATWSGTDFTTAVVAISSGPDLSLLADQSEETVTPELATTNAPAGTSVWVAGYPLGDQLTLTSGRIVDYVDGAEYGAPVQVAEVTDRVEPGNSGSPLLDAAGKVVGIVFAISKVDGHGLVIPISALRSFLAAPGTTTTGSCI